MIVIPSALVLAEADLEQPLTHARIGIHSHLRGLSDADVTASSTAEGSAKDAPLREDTFEYWEPTSLPAWWQVDFGEHVNIDYAGILGLIGSARVAVQITTSTNGVDFTEFADEVMPADDAPLMGIDTLRAVRVFRINLTGGGVMPRLSNVYAGLALAMQRAVYGGLTPLPLARKTVRHQHFSKGGQFLGQAYRRLGIAASIPWRHLTAEWYRENFDPFVKLARGYPYFIAWRPETYPNEVGFVWTDEDITPTNMGKRDFMSVTLPMEGVGWE